MIYLHLFFEFFKTGLFAVGGGLATIPFLYEMSAKTGWFTYEELANMIAVSESTPGPMGINMATYVGFETSGILGSICATIGIVTPSVIIILIIAKALQAFRSNRYVDAAFYGIRPCSLGLIAAAGAIVAKIALFNVDLFMQTGLFTDLVNIRALILAAVLLVLTRAVKYTKNLHPLWFIAFSAVMGILLKY
ncbi:MAG: chromate transporter [Oscillospiraceae bacterium]|nr:chromate transporter [Oscillospiraceae bacterium]